ncbi:MAG: hypothetical protein HY291_02175 [Planctomycetes bacterium]|nr:hypothetical protein [Planctomycetota bacterium]
MGMKEFMQATRPTQAELDACDRFPWLLLWGGLFVLVVGAAGLYCHAHGIRF